MMEEVLDFYAQPAQEGLAPVNGRAAYQLMGDVLMHIAHEAEQG